MTAIADAPGTPVILRLAPGPGPRDWRDQAACAEVDPALWFPEKGESTKAPKMICQGCPVRAECLDYALEHEAAARWGVWGGLTWEERRVLRRQVA